MKRLDDNGGGNAGKSGSTMRRLLSSSDTSNNPSPFGGKPLRLTPFIVPAALVIALLIGVAILAYSLGVSRGRGTANLERDKFYEGRAASWVATATAQAAASSTTPGPKSGASFPNYARIDKVEAEQVTVLLLNDSGTPTGTTLVIAIGPQTKVWRNVPTQTVELKPGDAILFAGERNDKGNFEARSIVVLPAS